MRHGSKKKLCSKGGWKNNAQIGGVCRRHGAQFKLCSRDGCTNKAQHEECADGMGQRLTDTNVLLMAAQIMASKEACASGMKQKNSEAGKGA